MTPEDPADKLLIEEDLDTAAQWARRGYSYTFTLSELEPPGQRMGRMPTWYERLRARARFGDYLPPPPPGDRRARRELVRAGGAEKLAFYRLILNPNLPGAVWEWGTADLLEPLELIAKRARKPRDSGPNKFIPEWQQRSPTWKAALSRAWMKLLERPGTLERDRPLIYSDAWQDLNYWRLKEEIGPIRVPDDAARDEYRERASPEVDAAVARVRSIESLPKGNSPHDEDDEDTEGGLRRRRQRLPDDLIDVEGDIAVRAVLDALEPRERMIARMLGDGFPESDVARALGVTEKVAYRLIRGVRRDGERLCKEFGIEPSAPDRPV